MTKMIGLVIFAYPACCAAVRLAFLGGLPASQFLVVCPERVCEEKWP